MNNYQSGVYRRADGVPLDINTEKVLEDRLTIDPQTYLPMQRQPVAEK